MALSAWLIQKEYGSSAEETVMQIQENPNCKEIEFFLNKSKENGCVD